MIDRLVIGTRGSLLALWQSNWVKEQLERLYPGLKVELRRISTLGDRILDKSLPALGEEGKGLFTLELEEAIRSGEIHLAVHSLKDLPTDLSNDILLAAVSPRADVRDALVARAGITRLEQLESGAVIGTSSLRRQAQLKETRRDLEVRPIRGNVDTRLRKLDAGEYDAIVLAAAGLERIGRSDRITHLFDPEDMLPAPGQGALGVQTGVDDAELIELVGALDHLPSRLACEAERAFLQGLGGGCLVPIAALATTRGTRMRLAGLVSDPDGREVFRDETEGNTDQHLELGRSLAESLLSQGAADLLRR